jgi:hypothetical protein
MRGPVTCGLPKICNYVYGIFSIFQIFNDLSAPENRRLKSFSGVIVQNRLQTTQRVAFDFADKRVKKRAPQTPRQIKVCQNIAVKTSP